MKELEALEIIEHQAQQWINDMAVDGCDLGSVLTLESFLRMNFQIIREALTPPTADEICKMLSEYLGYDVTYGTHYTFVGEVEICWLEDGKVVFNIDLPPHIIVMIGKFYGGVVES